MTTFGIARLACRVLALYFFLSLLQQFSVFLWILLSRWSRESFEDGIGFQTSIMLAGVLSYAGISALLWIFSDPIAKRMVGAAEEKIEDSRITVEDLATIVFAGIGVYVLSSAIPNLIRIPYWLSQPNPQRPYLWVGQLLPEVARILIGLWLVFRPRGFAKILHEFQEFAMTEPLDKST